MSIFDAKEEIRKLESLDYTQTNALVIYVDQEVAKFLLSKNFDSNRNVSSHRYLAYRQIMSDQEWVLGDPLKFSVSGKLIDGQHRLYAVPPGMIIPFVILTGQPDIAAETYDQGMRRNTLHIAKIRGVELINYHVSILRMMFIYRFADKNRLSSVLSPQKMVSIFEKHESIKEAIDFSLRYRSKSFAHVFAPILAVIARAYMSDYPISNDELDFFLYIFQGGSESDYPGSCKRFASIPLALRNIFLSTNKKVGNTGGNYRLMFFFKAQSALVAYSQDRKAQFFKETEKNVFPVPLLDFMDTKTLDMNIAA